MQRGLSRALLTAGAASVFCISSIGGAAAQGLVTRATATPTVVDETIIEDQNVGLLEELVRAPHWLTIRGQHRTRFEYLSEPDAIAAFGQRNRLTDSPPNEVAYAINSPGEFPDALGAFALQTSVHIEAQAGRFSFGAEIVDSRSYTLLEDRFRQTSDDMNTINLETCQAWTCIQTNAFEPLQAYATYRLGDWSGDGSITVGRFTMALGSERLITRSDFRNTIQSFHGGKADFRLFGDDRMTLFYTLPHSEDILETDNDLHYDVPDSNRRFWGVHYEISPWSGDTPIEAYVYGRNGREFPGSTFRRTDSKGIQITPGLRLSRRAKPRSFDFDLESTFQYANDRFALADGHNLGFFAHMELGRTFENKWRTRISTLFDIASGDKNEAVTVESQITSGCYASPNFSNSLCYLVDTSSANRRNILNNISGATLTSLALEPGDIAAFDSLFGDFSRDFGPEGLLGAFRRSNIISPAVRIETTPSEKLRFSATYRAARPYENPSYFSSEQGNIATELNWAHQIDAQTSYNLLDDMIILEAGAAVVASEYKQSNSGRSFTPLFFSSSNTVTATDSAVSFYGYTSVTFRF